MGWRERNEDIAWGILVCVAALTCAVLIYWFVTSV